MKMCYVVRSKMKQKKEKKNQKQNMSTRPFRQSIIRIRESLFFFPLRFFIILEQRDS